MHEIYLRSAKRFAAGFLVGIVIMVCSFVFTGIITLNIAPMEWVVWFLAVLMSMLFGCLNAMD